MYRSHCVWRNKQTTFYRQPINALRTFGGFAYGKVANSDHCPFCFVLRQVLAV